MIGARLYRLRKDAGLTQDELADILHINKHSISSYERGKSEPPDILKVEIARFFRVSADYLLGITEDPRPYLHLDNTIVLPRCFPEASVPELLRYADYLIWKAKHAHESVS